MIRNNTDHPHLYEDVDKLDDLPESAAVILIEMSALLGASEEWDSSFIEGVAELLNQLMSAAGLPEVSDQSDEALKHWRAIADELGIEHDGEPEDDEDEEEEIIKFIDLGTRNVEQGYADSMQLIYDVLTDMGVAGAEQDLKYSDDRHEMLTSSYDIDVCHDILIEWEELAEEAGLRAYADGEAGVYRVVKVADDE